MKKFLVVAAAALVSGLLSISVSAQGVSSGAGLPPASVFVDGGVPNHVQGIAYDAEKNLMYLSFTTRFVKADMDGNILASIDRIQGHLGAMTFDPRRRKVYASLECKDDVIGAGIAKNLNVDAIRRGESVFYVAVIDVDRMDRLNMDPERDVEVLKTVCINDAVNDYLANVSVDGKTLEHRFGCSGIDGVAIAPSIGKRPGKDRLYVAYGIYGDKDRPDNDYQVILCYDIRKFLSCATKVVFGENHYNGPKPLKKYFVHTGNTNWGVQNMTYDPLTRNLFLAVYKGSKSGFPNYDWFAVNVDQKPFKAELKGVPYSGPQYQLNLSSLGTADPATGQKGWRFKWGSTGICSLGNGLWYISENGRDPETKIQYSNVRLYRWLGETDAPFVPAR